METKSHYIVYFTSIQILCFFQGLEPETSQYLSHPLTYLILFPLSEVLVPYH